VILVWFKLVEKTVMPIMVFLQTTPKIAVAPLFLIWFGVGYTPKVIISFWLAYFPIVINMITGLRDIQPEMIDLASSMSATKLQTFIKIRLPNSLPYFFSGLKLGGIVALLGAVVGEYVGADKGLGYLIMWANSSYDIKLLFSVVIALVLLGKVIYSMVTWIERYAISWHVIARSEEEKLFTA
jgi:NitT/TauT family transport system permease protein